MDQKVILYQDQAVLHTDLLQMQTNAEQAMDLLTLEAIGPGLFFSRMTATKTDTWEVSVAEGSIYVDGLRYRNRATAVLDLFNVRPVSQKKVVAIIATGSVVNSTPELRDFATDAEGTTWEPQPVSTAALRTATIEMHPGVEAAVPNKPTISNGAVLIALVTLGTSGVETVEMQESWRLPQALANSLAIAEAVAFQQGFGVALETIRTDLAALADQLNGFVTSQTFAAFMTEFNAVKAAALQALDLAENADYIVEHVDSFYGTTLSDDQFAGYIARIENGLRFDFDTSDDTLTLDLVNPQDSKVKVTNNFALPAYSEVVRLSTYDARNAGSQALNAYSNVLIEYKTGRAPVYSMGYGPAYTMRVSHVFDGYNVGAPKSIVHNGVTHYLVDNEVDNSKKAPVVGQIVESILEYRPYQQQVSHHEEYTFQETSTQNLTSQGRAQVFLTQRAGWLTAVDLYLDSVGAANDLRVMIAEAPDGDPDIARILTETNVSFASLAAAGEGQSGGMRVQVQPTLLRAGKRYAVVVLSQGNHTVRTSNTKAGVVNGDFYYLSSDGRWVKTEPALQMQMQLVYAKFNATRVAVDMEPLQLTGGIDSVKIFTEVITPAATRLDYEVQIGGNWYLLGAEVGSRLAADMSSAGSLLPLRVVFIGTEDMMPGVGIKATKSAITTSRAATSMVHVSSLHDLGGGVTASTIKIRVRAENWDDAKHTLDIELINGGTNAVIEATAIEEIVRDADTTEFVATFDLSGGPLQTFRYKIIGGTNDAEDQFYVAERRAMVYAS